ncbi:MAG: isoprenylcysteine carboxylmethyltransferase family protein [Candidatus Aminicenantes bacterium]|jgi:protein-S-isoprenylcysteine O-methyltransferase Ste14
MAESRTVAAIYKWRVRVGLLGLILSVVIAQPTPLSFILGLVLTDVGLLLRLWACGHLRKEKELTTSGPYRYTRNPLYLGNLIIGLGVVAGSYSGWVALIVALYFLVFYPVIILEEKKKMQKLFPEEYGEYSQKVPLFLPNPRTALPVSEERFSWSLFQKNKEYRAWFGALVYWTIFAVKMIVL